MIQFKLGIPRSQRGIWLLRQINNSHKLFDTLLKEKCFIDQALWLLFIKYSRGNVESLCNPGTGRFCFLSVEALVLVGLPLEIKVRGCKQPQSASEPLGVCELMNTTTECLARRLSNLGFYPSQDLHSCCPMDTWWSLHRTHCTELAN